MLSLCARFNAKTCDCYLLVASLTQWSLNRQFGINGGISIFVRMSAVAVVDCGEIDRIKAELLRGPKTDSAGDGTSSPEARNFRMAFNCALGQTVKIRRSTLLSQERRKNL